MPVAADTVSEASESFTVTLSLPVNATIADGTATGTITDDDPLPVLSIGDASGAEGNSGTTNLVFTATLTPASGQSVTVSYQTANGTAAAASRLHRGQRAAHVRARRDDQDRSGRGHRRDRR